MKKEFFVLLQPSVHPLLLFTFCLSDWHDQPWLSCSWSPLDSLSPLTVRILLSFLYQEFDGKANRLSRVFSVFWAWNNFPSYHDSHTCSCLKNNDNNNKMRGCLGRGVGSKRHKKRHTKRRVFSQVSHRDCVCLTFECKTLDHVMSLVKKRKSRKVLCHIYLSSLSLFLSFDVISWITYSG